ncbi:hypothetical protein PS684_03427 [Pseudomonas fluorescens]|nr:hypothetical protein PS681_00688 [Pseudomonas fluorescens]VVN59113.1 hypothetical protein PS684_03427 [Pseudomonas fluorescens]
MCDIRGKCQHAFAYKPLNQKSKRVLAQPGQANFNSHFVIPRQRSQQLDRHRTHRRQYIKTHHRPKPRPPYPSVECYTNGLYSKI